MLVIKNLSLYLCKDLRVLLEDFNFSLMKDQKVALIGEEGNGKSSLLKAIYEPEKLQGYMKIKGEIYKDGEIIGYLPQSLDESILRMTTLEYLEKNIIRNDFDYPYFYRMLKEIDFPESRISPEIKIKNLSGGEKIKFQLVIEMMKKPTVLLLDEPGNDLDLKSVIWLEDFIKRLNIPIIFVSHDETLLENCSNTIIHLEQLKRKSKPKYTISRMKYSEYLENRRKHILKQTQLAIKEKEEYDVKMEKYRQIYGKVQHELRKTKIDTVGKNLQDKMHTLKSMGRRFEKEKENMKQKPDFEDNILVRFNDEISIPNGKQILNLNLNRLKIDNLLLSKNIKLQIFGPKKVCIVGGNGSGKTTLLKEILKELDRTNIPYGYMPQDYSDLILIESKKMLLNF